MPKSNNNRKNGRAKGSAWNKRVAKDVERRKAQKEDVLAKITKEILG